MLNTDLKVLNLLNSRGFLGDTEVVKSSSISYIGLELRKREWSGQEVKI